MKIASLFSKYRNISETAKAPFWFAFANILQKFAQFLVVPIYTRTLSSEEYGTYSLFLTWTNILLVFATLNIASAAIDRGMMKYESDRDRLISACQGFGMTITIIYAIIMSLVLRFWSDKIGMPTNLMWIMIVYFLTYPPYCMWMVRERFEGQYKSVLFTTILIAIFTPIISLLLIRYLQNSAVSLAIGYVSIQGVIGTVIAIRAYIKGGVYYDREYWLYGLRFCLPLIPHFLSGIILMQMDRIMIDHFYGKKEIAIYSISNNVAQATSAITGGINVVLIPFTYKKLARKENQDLSKVTSWIGCLLLGISILIILFAPEIVNILAPVEYSYAVYMIPALTTAVFVQFAISRLINIEYSYEANISIMFSSVIAAVINLVLNYTLMPRHGYSIAANTTLWSYMIQCLYCAIVVRKCNSERISPFPYKDYAILIIMMVAFEVIMINIYHHPFVRVLSFISIACIIVLVRKRIAKALTDVFSYVKPL